MGRLSTAYLKGANDRSTVHTDPTSLRLGRSGNDERSAPVSGAHLRHVSRVHRQARPRGGRRHRHDEPQPPRRRGARRRHRAEPGVRHPRAGRARRSPALRASRLPSRGIRRPTARSRSDCSSHWWRRGRCRSNASFRCPSVCRSLLSAGREMAELEVDDFNVSSTVDGGAAMVFDRRFSLPLVLTLGVSLFASACSKKDNTTTTAPSCSFSVVQPTTIFGPEGGTGSAPITVTAGTGCNWTATSSAAFVAFTTGSGTGSGTAAFTVAVNTGAERTSTLTIAGSAITITQRAAVATPPATRAAPTPRSPGGGQDVELRPTLVVNNAAATGNVGTVTYRFEVSSDST